MPGCNCCSVLALCAADFERMECGWHVRCGVPFAPHVVTCRRSARFVGCRWRAYASQCTADMHQPAGRTAVLLDKDCVGSNSRWPCSSTWWGAMCCCVVLSRAVLRCAVLLQAQVNALVAENESLHEQLAKATSRLADASAASRAATAAVTTDADKARFQVRLSLEGGASWLAQQHARRHQGG